MLIVIDYLAGSDLPAVNAVVTDKSFQPGYYTTDTDSRGNVETNYHQPVYRVYVDLGFGDIQTFTVSSGIYETCKIGDEVKAVQRIGKITNCLYNNRLMKY